MSTSRSCPLLNVSLLLLLIACASHRASAQAQPPAGGFQANRLFTAPAAAGTTAKGLVWDTESKEYTSQPGERYAKFSFWFTNITADEVLINSAQSSCFCTVAKLPSQPWRIPAGSNGPIEVTMDLAGKSGMVMKGVFVESSAGRYNLTVRTTVTPSTDVVAARSPTMKDDERLKNIQAALADRQSVFKRNECASCHAEPAKGKTEGSQVYAAVCANCHDSPFRASQVPDLKNLSHPTNLEHWRHWITYGRPGSMMPAFAQAEGGPLTDQQIQALAAHLTKTISTQASFKVPVASGAPGGGGGSGGR